MYQKNLLDVKNIEVARIICLKKTNIELVSVTIPRVKVLFKCQWHGGMNFNIAF